MTPVKCQACKGPRDSPDYQTCSKCRARQREYQRDHRAAKSKEAKEALNAQHNYALATLRDIETALRAASVTQDKD